MEFHSYSLILPCRFHLFFFQKNLYYLYFTEHNKVFFFHITLSKKHLLQSRCFGLHKILQVLTAPVTSTTLFSNLKAELNNFEEANWERFAGKTKQNVEVKINPVNVCLKVNLYCSSWQQHFVIQLYLFQIIIAQSCQLYCSNCNKQKSYVGGCVFLRVLLVLISQCCHATRSFSSEFCFGTSYSFSRGA